MAEGWLIDSNDNWIWRFHRDNSAWVRDPKVFIDRGRQMPNGPPNAQWSATPQGASVFEEGRSRAVVEVISDPGMEEDETLMGRFRRTLKPFRSEIVSVLIRRGGVVLGLSDWCQVVSSSRIWMAVERSLSLAMM